MQARYSNSRRPSPPRKESIEGDGLRTRLGSEVLGPVLVRRESTAGVNSRLRRPMMRPPTLSRLNQRSSAILGHMSNIIFST